MASETMPYAGLKICNWSVVQRQTAPFTQGGAGAVIDMGEPYWMMDCSFESLTETQHRALTSFIARRNGAAVPFRAYRADRQSPADIPNAGALSPTISQVSAGVVQITTGANKMAEGDMVAYRTSTGARYVGEVADVLSMQVDSIQCRLYPFAPSPNGQLQIYRAEGLFTLEPDSVSGSEPYDRRRSVRFLARQLQRPFTEP